MLHPSILFLFFFCSGFAGLVFEISWCRILLRALGAGTSANACVFSGFMAGAAIGAAAGWRFPQAFVFFLRAGNNRRPVNSLDYFRTYGRLELLAGLCGWLICLLFTSRINEGVAGFIGAFSQYAWLSHIIRFLICFFWLLLPCASMGCAFAALIKAVATASREYNFFPLLYGFNTLGAACGSIIAALFLLPLAGIICSAFAAFAVNMLVFVCVELLAAQRGRSSVEDPPLAQAGKAARKPAAIWIACAYMSGFLALLLEITWTRIFSLVLGSSVLSVAAVLLMVLLGAGLSALCLGRLRIDEIWARRLVSFSFLMAGLITLAGSYANKFIYELFVAFSTSISPLVGGDPYNRALLARFFLTFVYVFLPSAFLGAVLPLSTMTESKKDNAQSGLIYAGNCLGALCACLLFAFVLFPVLANMTHTVLLAFLIMVAFLSVLVSSALMIRQAFKAGGHGRVVRLICAFLCLALPTAFALKNRPPWDAGLLSCGFLVYGSGVKARIPAEKNTAKSLLEYFEGINSTVSSAVYPQSNSVSLRSDGKVEATLPLDPSLISPGSDLSTHVLLGGLPLLFHDGKAESALLIGMGSGVTASTLLSFPEIKHLTVAELEPSVIKICDGLSKYNGAPLSPDNFKSGRLALRLEDARFTLSSSGSKYDLVVCQPADPWVSGSADLYTEEFWSLAVSRLHKNGVFCQWLQLYAIPQKDLLSLLRTFNKVFKSVYICQAPGAGELLLLGFRDGADAALVEPDKAISVIDERIQQSSRKNIFLAQSGLAEAYDALSFVLSDARQSRQICNSALAFLSPINTDDRPYVEYATGAQVLTGDSQLADNLNFLSGLFLKENIGYLPDFKEDREKYACLGRALARLCIQDGTPLKSWRQRRSIRALDKAVWLDKTPFSCWSKAVVLRALGEKADCEMDRTLVCRDTDDLSKMSLFDFEFENNDLEKSSQMLRSCSCRIKKSANWMLRQGFLLLRQGQAQAALDIFQHLQAENPSRLAALLGKACAAQRRGDTVTALNETYHYLCINPWDFQSQFNYTVLACKQNRLADALAHARCSVRLRPENVAALMVVLKYRLMSGNFDESSKILDLIKESPGDREATSLLKLLDYKRIPHELLDNPVFNRYVKSKIESAEDIKNGYKILGEP